MQKIILAFLIVINFVLTSCIVMRSPDSVIDKSPRLALQERYANEDETNLGLSGASQPLYIFMYGFYAGMATIGLPFSDEFHKSDWKTIILDDNAGENIAGDPVLFLNPQCESLSGRLLLITGFFGDVDKLTLQKNEKNIPQYEINKDDIYLLNGDRKILPEDIYIAGKSLNKITSRGLKISYPFFRTKQKFQRFVSFPIKCDELKNGKTYLVISRINNGDSITKNALVNELIINNSNKYSTQVLFSSGLDKKIIRMQK